MDNLNRQEFAAIVSGLLKTYNRPCDESVLSIWWNSLKQWPIGEVSAAISLLVTDGGNPVPANVIKYLPDPLGWPGAEAMWNGLPKSEHETRYVNDGQMEAAASCQDSIDRDDMIGARVAFLEAYKSMVQARRAAFRKPLWWVSHAIGLSHEDRKKAVVCALQDARTQKWISEHGFQARLLTLQPSYPDKTLPEVKRLTKKITA